MVLSCWSVAALAVEVQKEGSYDHDECWVGDGPVLTHSDKIMAGSFKAYGISAAAKPGSPNYNAAGTCVGSWTLINGEYNETSACEYVDPDKDKFFGVASRKNDEGVWRVIGGTGKYAGMTSTSRWKPTVENPQPDGHMVMCLHDKGTWKLK
jgi:hypothetical protein